jgi:DNA-binding transcriptional LysR family regulator
MPNTNPGPIPHVSLEQWRTLLAVVDAGGYRQAAERLNKSQSAVTYAVQKIEAQLAVGIFTLEGRKARLTPAGEILCRRARALLDEAGGLERAARTLSTGWEGDIRIAVEILFPPDLLFRCLEEFGADSPLTRVEVLETVLGGGPDALIQRQADLAIIPHMPAGFLGTPLPPLSIVPVAHPDHPLHRLGRTLTVQDLRPHRHLVVRDTGPARDRRALSVEVERRWTFGHIAATARAAALGLGFVWLPKDLIRAELAAGTLKQLPLGDGGERRVQMYLVVADPDFAGPGTRRLAAIIRRRAESELTGT